MARLLRRLVSKRKRRYQRDGFDLDLVYIDCAGLKGRLLAMGFPCEGREAWYRNSLEDVRRFLEYKRDSDGAYKVYNLTTERPQYSPEKLGGQLAHFPFDDRQVPSLDQMRAFCQDLDGFLAEHPSNFAAVHCRAGKGRTGVMICAYLLHKGLVRTAVEAMRVYAQQRSVDESGISVPSQQRYVHYFEAVMADGRVPPPAPLVLNSISISGLCCKQLSQLVVNISVRSPAGEIVQAAEVAATPESVRVHQPMRYAKSTPTVQLQPAFGHGTGLNSKGCLVTGDVRLEVFLGKVSKKKLLFRTWFNTAFISAGSFTLRDSELDKGVTSVKEGTVLRMQFSEPASPAIDSDHTDALPILDIPATDSPVSDTIPAVNPGTSAPSSEIERFFSVHPDFSLPSSLGASLLASPPPPSPGLPFNNPFAREACQLPASPGDPGSAGSSSSLQALTAKLETIASSASMEAPHHGVVPNCLNASRRTQSSPFPQLHYSASIKEMLTVPRTLSSVRSGSRQQSAHSHEDPESLDLSAPTTPSLPRPFAAFDWHHDHTARLQDVGFTGRSQSADGHTGMEEGTSSGPDSPSHGARLIKWMSASWWLDMA